MVFSLLTVAALYERRSFGGHRPPLQWRHQFTAALCRDLTFRKDSFAAADRSLHGSAEGSSQIRTQCMTLQQVLRLQRKCRGKIHQHKIRAGAGYDAASIRNTESPGRLGGD